jgi:hypothetical protein
LNDDNLEDASKQDPTKRNTGTDAAFKLWEAHLVGDVPAALTYANEAPLSEKGEIVFSIRDNGQVWLFALLPPAADSTDGLKKRDDADTYAPEPIETVVDDVSRDPSTDGTARFWRGDLWGNVPQAVNWANQAPVEIKAGQIIFNVRDNGQVWTYTLANWPV